MSKNTWPIITAILVTALGVSVLVISHPSQPTPPASQPDPCPKYIEITKVLTYHPPGWNNGWYDIQARDGSVYAYYLKDVAPYVGQRICVTDL